MSDSLAHYGIPGMKWGRRKAKVSVSEDHSRAAALKKRDPSSLSNKELKDLNTRLQLEKSYKDLTKSEVSAGQKYVQSLPKTIANIAVSTLASTLVNKGIKRIGL